MAERKTEKRVEVILPRLSGQNANQDEFYSVNFKNYIIKRGEPVMVPEEVANVIKDNMMAETYAMKYIDEKAVREPGKD